MGLESILQNIGWKDLADIVLLSLIFYRIMVLEQGRGEATLSKQTAREILTRYPQSAEAPLAQTYLDQNPA